MHMHLYDVLLLQHAAGGKKVINPAYNPPLNHGATETLPQIEPVLGSVGHTACPGQIPKHTLAYPTAASKTRP